MKKLNIDKSLQNDKSYKRPQGMIVGVVFTIIILTISVCVYAVIKKIENDSTSNTSGLPNEVNGSLSTETGNSYFSESEVTLRLEALKEEFPDGKYWNHAGIELEEGQASWSYVTDTPCDHSFDGTYNCNIYDGVTLMLFPDYEHLTQCLGFSSMISDRLFGEDASITVFQNYEQLKIGDQIRLIEEMHSMVVLSKKDDYITVAEVDEDTQSCKISWGRILYLYELEDYGENTEYYTRYPAE